MKLNEFNDYVEHRAAHETIYDDSEGRRIVVIRMLDLYFLVNELIQKAKHDMAISNQADTQRPQGTEVQPKQ